MCSTLFPAFLEIFNSKSRILTEIVRFPHFVNFWDRFFPFVAKIKNRVTYNLLNAEGNSNGTIPSFDPISNDGTCWVKNHNQAKTFHV